MIRENSSSDKIIRWLVLLAELTVLNAALLALFYFYNGDTFMTTPNCKRLMLLMTLVYAICDMHEGSKVHHRFVRSEQLLRNLIITLTSFTLLSLLVMWVFRWPLMTWGFMLPFYTSVISAMVLLRWSARQVIKWYRRTGRNSMSAVFVGNINIASEMYQQMEQDASCGYRILGYFADNEEPDITKRGYLGKTEEVLTFLHQEGHRLHHLYCILPSSQNDLINKIMEQCDKHLIRYNHIPDSFNYKRHSMGFKLMVNTPVFSIHNEPLSQPGNRFVKRCFDLIFSLLFLIIVFPWIYIIFGTVIKLSSPGPVLFKQRRSGLEGKDFMCYKFRSMRLNADSDKVQASKNDPRKTAIGEFMRKTSIDELPQFINVLKGEMSVVGPRPHMIRHTEKYSEMIDTYMVRHFAKPGITGLAQVSGFRGETKELWQMEGRIQKDIWYIENWSFELDIMIILKTITNAVHGEKNAY